VLILWLNYRNKCRDTRERTGISVAPAPGSAPARLWTQHGAAILAGLALLLAGIGIYLPVGGQSGRYAMPAVWGADILLAVLLTALADAPRPAWTGLFCKAAVCILASCCLLPVAVANLGKQSKFCARNGLLWQALNTVQRTLPPQARLVWIAPTDGPGSELQLIEGTHFGWHLRGQGRRDIDFQRPLAPELAEALKPESAGGVPLFALTGTGSPPPAEGWHLREEFHRPYWLGLRAYHCFLWSRETL
jgi:hypothetical protein